MGAFDKVLDEVRKLKLSKADSLGIGDPEISGSVFSKENFHTIVQPSGSGKLVFIDGGNASIISSPQLCVDFVRVFHSVWQDGKRVSCGSDEFYVLSVSSLIQGKISYSAKMFSDKPAFLGSFLDSVLSFDPLDDGLRQGKSRSSISNVANIVRRLAELKVASEAVKKTGCLAVLDGDFSFSTAYEKNAIMGLASAASSSGSAVLALSKTSDLLASNGASVSTVLASSAPGGCWYYFPAGTKQFSKVFFAKLHNRSDYIFKVELLDVALDVDVPSFLSLLSSNSKDPVFLGYPYGLIEADMFARVSNKEQETLKVSFASKAGKDWNLLDSLSKSSDAHHILDRIRY